MSLRVVAVGSLVLMMGCLRPQTIAAPQVVVVGAVATPDSAPNIEAEVGTWRPKELVEVEWRGSWFPATVLEKRSGQWLVHYDGYGTEWDEVVGSDRIRARKLEIRRETETPEIDEPDP